LKIYTIYKQLPALLVEVFKIEINLHFVLFPFPTEPITLYCPTGRILEIILAVA
jgi:hypothetical protein